MAINGMPEELMGALGNPSEQLCRTIAGSRINGTADAGLTIGSSSTAAIRQNVAVDYQILGLKKAQKAAGETAFTADTHDIPAKAASVQERVYTVYLASDGTRTILAGEIATGAGNANIPIKAVPFNAVILGWVRIAVAAGSTKFDAGSDALNAGHLTVTYTSIMDFVWTSGMV